MPIKIGGDTLALDADVRHQIQTEADRLVQRFPGEEIDARVTIQESFDPLHGHRVRCELSARVGAGRQVVVREARKIAAEAITATFAAARRNVRRTRRPTLIECAAPSTAALHAAGRA